MKAVLQGFNWVERPKLSREMILILAIGAASLFTFFKLKPYFERKPSVITASHTEVKPSGLAGFLAHFGLGTTASQGSSEEHSLHNPGSGSSRGKFDHAPAIIERPLFDGLTVTLKAVLVNSVSSAQSDAPVEATILRVIPDETTRDVDADPAQGAKIMGRMNINMAMKRLGFEFSELVTQEGRSYSVSGIAFDPTTQTIGIAAHYSSGLASRLLGVGLDQAINLADQVATAKVLQNTAGDSPVTQEMQAASVVVGQQATTGISAEATQDLRSTPPELSLPARTVILVRLRVLSDQTGGRR